jgi:uncharacterized membrane protein
MWYLIHANPHVDCRRQDIRVCTYSMQILCLAVHVGGCCVTEKLEFTLLSNCSMYISLDSLLAEVTATVTLNLKSLDLLHWN